MTRDLFGTDGIRGKANTDPMTAATAMKLGMAAGAYFTQGSHRHSVVIGKDTRLSGYMLEPALVSGFISVGMDVFLVGPMPTPAVAMLTRSLRADLGVMISASHNPYYDNGIKLFSPNGLKLSDEAESEIESLMEGDKVNDYLASPDKLGRAKRIDDCAGRYIEYVKHTFPKRQRLSGLKVVLDCANGAAYHIGPKILWELGAEVITLGVEPNGFNINEECGATSPEKLCQEVVAQKADIGIALDGDADRVIISDEKGQIIDGDQVMAVIAAHQQKQGTLQGGGIVATQMSNLGLDLYLQSIGLHLVRTQVGDRYVAETMREKGYNIGGEQSGHIIVRDYATTGDGLIAALQVLATVVEKEQPVSEVCNVFEPLPQILKNIPFTGKDPLAEKNVQSAIKKAEDTLGNTGRVFIRKSGTEPLIRIMLEGENDDLIEQLADDIAGSME